MAIVLPDGRPAIDIENGGYERPEEPWAHLGDPEPRARLQAAIGAVGCLEEPDNRWNLPFLGTAFVVGPDLVLSCTGRQQHGSRLEDAVSRGASLAVNFGRERILVDAVRIEVADDLYVDPRWGVEVLKAPVPGVIEPLHLSLMDPATLEDREVVLLGYPSSDTRNDPALVERIFRGVLDVKRLLPGRITGLDQTDPDRPVLLHDCSSTGGCGGGPLVDIVTGEVVGIHLGGQYLQSNQAIPSFELARDPGVVYAGVFFAGRMPKHVPALATPGAPPSEEMAAVDVPADRVPLDDDPGYFASRRFPSVSETEGPLERLVSELRPALIVGRWREDAGDDWGPFLMPHEQRLNSAIRAVGQLHSGASSDGWSGTAFLVGERIALTASFVAQNFADGSGLQANIKPAARPVIDFGQALGVSPGVASAQVTGVKFIHPYFHVALVELDRIPEGVTRLDLASQLPSQLSGRYVAVVSFAARPLDEPAERAEFQATAFRGLWDHMFVQPGKALQVGHLPDDSGLPALVHDCTTAPGSAGGPVVDLGTGYVIGVHTHAKWLEGGWAQPTWELARDPVLWESRIEFRPDPRPPWLERWEESGSASLAPLAVAPDTRPPRWTVDDVPIDWSREEPRRLESLLVLAIDAQIALYKAENAGLTLGTVNRNAAPQIVWREILRNAATAGLLRRLVEELANDPSYAGIAPKLRESL